MMPVRNFNRWRNFNRQRKQTGKRSGLEVQLASQLDKAGVKYEYEPQQGKIDYIKHEEKKYVPDFVLANGVIVEAKGEFTSKDRKKHLLIQEQHPKLDIRFVFSNPNQRIGKGSNTTYAMWCERHGFQYAKAFIPDKWLGCQHNNVHEWEEGGHSTRRECADCDELL
jgi:hypothetical protein